MRTKQIVTRTILAAVAAGTIATGITVPLLAAAAPAATSVTVAAPNYMPYA